MNGLFEEVLDIGVITAFKQIVDKDTRVEKHNK